MNTNVHVEDTFISFTFTSNVNMKNTLGITRLPTNLYTIYLNSALVAVQVPFDTVEKYCNQYFYTSTFQTFKVEYTNSKYPPFELNLETYKADYAKYPSIHFFLKLLAI